MISRGHTRQPAVLGQRDTKSRRHRPDYGLVIISLVLLVVGLIVVYAVSPGLSAQRGVPDNYFVVKQLIAISLAAVTFILVSRMPLAIWPRLVVPLAIISLVALVATQVFGEEVNGASRWVQVGGLSFQAVELVKFTLIIWLATFLGRQRSRGELDDVRNTLKPIAIGGAVLTLFIAVFQSDLGSMGVVAAIAGAMLFAAGLSLRWFGLGIAAVLVGGLLLIALSPYRQDRVATFLNPQADCLEEGYQSCQALIAIGSGGVFGRGVDRSAQAYGYLPEAANDSIFAVLAEMFGFLGVSLVVGLLIGLFTRLLRIAERAPTMEARLMVVGVLAWVSTQAFINIMAMVGLFPLKGITLPFISYGGTSIVFITAAVGLAFQVSRYTTYTVNEQLDAVETVTNQRKGALINEGSTKRGRHSRPHYTPSYRRT
jgi:cell division protein FtsW